MVEDDGWRLFYIDGERSCAADGDDENKSALSSMS